MSPAEYDAALAQFLANKAVIRCPTACVGPTRVSVPEDDRAALRGYNDVRETAGLEKLRSFQQRLAG